MSTVRVGAIEVPILIIDGQRVIDGNAVDDALEEGAITVDDVADALMWEQLLFSSMRIERRKPVDIESRMDALIDIIRNT